MSDTQTAEVITETAPPAETQETQEPKTRGGLLADAPAVAPQDTVDPAKEEVEHKAQENLEKTEEPAPRPEWLEAKFETVEDQAKSYKELNTKFSQGKHKPPKDGVYDMTVATKANVKEEDPMLAEFTDIAKDVGLSQDAYDRIVTGVLKVTGDVQAADQIDNEREMALLGPQAVAIKSDAIDWGRGLVEKGVWTAEHYDEYAYFCGTAIGVQAARKMRAFFGDVTTLPTSLTPQAEALPTKQELQEMVGTKLYKESAAERARVAGEFKRVHGDGPDQRIVG